MNHNVLRLLHDRHLYLSHKLPRQTATMHPRPLETPFSYFVLANLATTPSRLHLPVFLLTTTRCPSAYYSYVFTRKE